ncbi:hypothetical protein AO393_26220 [Pseudomonas syringae pv. syringae]|nr:hypothetical protein AO393_26220 [Pseudomonas syringae pv. syringae]
MLGGAPEVILSLDYQSSEHPSKFADGEQRTPCDVNSVNRFMLDVGYVMDYGRLIPGDGLRQRGLNQMLHIEQSTPS